MTDLIILAFVVAFVSVATLGHILLGAALLVGRRAKPTVNESGATDERMMMPARAANDSLPTAGELAA